MGLEGLGGLQGGDVSSTSSAAGSGGFSGLGGLSGGGKTGGSTTGTWQVSHTQQGGFNTQWNPNKTNIGLIAVQVAEMYAFTPMEAHVSDLSELMDQTTSLETGLNTFSNMTSLLMEDGSNSGIADTGAGTQFANAESAFQSSFNNIYKTGQPTNPKFSSLTFTVRYQLSPGAPIQTATIHADNPMLKPYWTAWQKSGGAHGDQMVTTDGNITVSGMQAYMAKYVQTQLDDKLLPMPKGTSGTPTPDAIGTALNSLLTTTGSPLLPSYTNTSNLAISTMYGVLQGMPSMPSSNDNPGSLYSPAKPNAYPTTSMLSDLFANPPNTQGLTNNLSFMAWVNHNSNGSSASPSAGENWVTSHSMTNTASSLQGSITHAESTVNTTSQTLSQNIQEISSELNVIDNAVAKIIESFSAFVKAVVSSYRGS